GRPEHLRHTERRPCDLGACPRHDRTPGHPVTTSRSTGSAEDASGIRRPLLSRAHPHARFRARRVGLLERPQLLSMKVRCVPGSPGGSNRPTTLMSSMPLVEPGMLPEISSMRRMRSMRPRVCGHLPAPGAMAEDESGILDPLCPRASPHAELL